VLYRNVFYEKITRKYYYSPTLSHCNRGVRVVGSRLCAYLGRDQVNMSKSNEKRIRFAPVPLAILDEYCELHGMTPSAAISPLIVEYLRHPSRDARHSSGMNNIVYTPPSKEPPKKAAKKKASSQTKLIPLPKDFDPPRAISEEAGVDHEMAVRFFKAQAEAKNYKYANWNKAFGLALNGYLVENFPQIKLTPQIKTL
jgi:hypothetical protein